MKAHELLDPNDLERESTCMRRLHATLTSGTACTSGASTMRVGAMMDASVAVRLDESCAALLCAGGLPDVGDGQ
jgi:hypothetical protein